jgi:hypothetical protein
MNHKVPHHYVAYQNLHVGADLQPTGGTWMGGLNPAVQEQSI